MRARTSPKYSPAERVATTSPCSRTSWLKTHGSQRGHTLGDRPPTEKAAPL